ncbi:DUF2848 domain-containing protein [Erwiniaceae bacterium BAC15a-03b]|uniref:DUF2848 domain-containing protein n=1 Tax=Winslowiella arboricola TaxID=2978220 RepID=A0A9J6PUB4_9GAMM|nr:DUF2848 domain-containing protein [Winslowiella arboricola]MCU5774781.1 DUF2848 domain-containing protein [Winslowiella arboricola]MCU5780067.1 DUF2848 domain-containing protein [Winslowiella arboricola]
MKLSFSLPANHGDTLNTDVNQLVIAGWTGRDHQAIMHHISELEALGVPRPGAVPLFYRVTTNQLTQADSIEVVGEHTSGEAEPFIFTVDGELYVSLASDHTDRQLETYSVAMSKQVCVKPVAQQAWAMKEVAGHWDSLILRSWIREQGEWVLYQDGTLASLRTPLDLLDRYTSAEAAGGIPANGLAMTCGTLGAIGGIRPASEFRMALVDETLGRTISHQYRSNVLPIVA